MIDVTYTIEGEYVRWLVRPMTVHPERGSSLLLLGFFAALASLGPLLPAAGFDGVEPEPETVPETVLCQRLPCRWSTAKACSPGYARCAGCNWDRTRLVPVEAGWEGKP